MDNLVSGVYSIRNTVNGKVYVGQAVNIEVRWVKHKSDLNCNRHDNQHLQRAWGKYGAEAFVFTVIEYCSVDQLNEREIHHIAVWKSQGLCYNMTDGGDGIRGYTHTEESRNKISETRKNMSEETKRKISEALRRRVIAPETRRKLSEARRSASEETRKKISEALKGKTRTDEARLKMSIAQLGNQRWLGKTHTEETKKKISEAAKRRVVSNETRQKLSEAGKGRTHTEESLSKMREAQSNRSVETRQRISEAKKKYWAEKKAAG